MTHKLQEWIDARRKYHLSHAQVQMARELGLNPKKFGKLANHKQEQWKEPLPQFIETIYFKRFGKTSPDHVVPIEEQAKSLEQKKAARKQRKALNRAAAATPTPEHDENNST